MNPGNPNFVTKLQGPGTALMKTSGILMIIFGISAFFVHVFSRSTIELARELLLGISTKFRGAEDILNRLGTSSLLALLSAIITLITGILSVIFCRKLGKGMPVIIFCVLSMALALINIVMELSTLGRIAELTPKIRAFTYDLSGSGYFNVLAIACSSILPVLAMVGVLKNKKLA